MRNLFIVVMMFSTSLITAQTNPSAIDLKVLKGQTFNYSLIGSNADLVVQTTILESAVRNADKNTFDMVFLSNETGSFKTVYKFEENGLTFYTTINIDISYLVLSTYRSWFCRHIGVGRVPPGKVWGLGSLGACWLGCLDLGRGG